MTRRTQPVEQVEDVYDAAEFISTAAPEVSQRRAPDRTPAHLRFIPPADSSEGEGRAYSMPFTPDRERWKRFIRGATDTRGVFMVELRNRNQSIIGRDSIEVEAEQGAQPYTPAPQASAAPAAPQYAPPAAGGTTEAVTTARELVGLAKDLTPPAPPAASLTFEDVDRRLDEKIDRIVERLKPAQQDDPADRFIKTLTQLKTLGLIPEKNPEPEQKRANPLHEALEVYREMRQVAAEVEPATEDKGLLAQAGSFINSLSGALSSPLAQGLIMRALGAQPAQGQPGAAPPGAQQPAQAADAQGAALAVLQVAVTDLRRNKRVGRTADAIDELVTAHPEIAGEINNLLSLPAPQVLAQLSAVAGEDLTGYTHAVEWVEDLAAEVLPDDEGEQPEAAEVPASSNGHRPGGVAAQG